MMVTPEQWKKELYISKEIETEELDDFGNKLDGYTEPLLLKLNYQPVKVETALREFGESIYSMYRAIVHIGTAEYDLFNVDEDEGSLAYLNGASPNKKPKWYKGEETVEPKHGHWANYEIFSIRPSNLSKIIYFVQYKPTGV